MMAAKKRKKASKSSHVRRLFIGARIVFDGNEDAGQVVQFANGSTFGEADIDHLIAGTFKWDIQASFHFKNGKTIRTVEKTFTAGPCRFNELTDEACEMATIAGLEMPEAYKFHKNTWVARIIG